VPSSAALQIPISTCSVHGNGTAPRRNLPHLKPATAGGKMWPAVSFDPPSADVSRGNTRAGKTSPGSGDRKILPGRDRFCHPCRGSRQISASAFPTAYAVSHIISPCRAWVRGPHYFAPERAGGAGGRFPMAYAMGYDLSPALRAVELRAIGG
jgi:hypothetical protein